jgi:hypothetical protein
MRPASRSAPPAPRVPASTAWAQVIRARRSASPDLPRWRPSRAINGPNSVGTGSGPGRWLLHPTTPTQPSNGVSRSRIPEGIAQVVRHAWGEPRPSAEPPRGLATPGGRPLSAHPLGGGAGPGPGRSSWGPLAAGAGQRRAPEEGGRLIAWMAKSSWPGGWRAVACTSSARPSAVSGAHPDSRRPEAGAGRRRSAIAGRQAHPGPGLSRSERTGGTVDGMAVSGAARARSRAGEFHMEHDGWAGPHGRSDLWRCVASGAEEGASSP